MEIEILGAHNCESRDTRLVSLDIGLILLGLGMSQHIYATASKLPSGAKR